MAEKLTQPTRFRAITPSDSTDVSLIVTKGLLVGSAGTVYGQGLNDSAIVLLGTFPAGAYIPGSFKKIGVSTTAVVVGCSG